MERRLEHQFDAQLLARARALATLTVADPSGQAELHFADEVMPEFERATDPDFFQVWVRTAVLERSRSLRGRGELGLTVPEPHDEPVFADLELPDGRAGRQVELDFVPQRPDDPGAPEIAPPPDETASGRVAVATGRGPLERGLAEIRALALGAGLLSLTLLVLFARWAVRTGLAPLGDLARAVEAVGPDDLDRRLQPRGAPREVAPLVERLNALLARLGEAVERERRVASDAAHELRSPVAELKNLATVGRRWPEDRFAVEGFFGDVETIASRMERTIDALLQLARIEAGIEPTWPESVDVGSLVTEVAGRSVEAPARGIGIEQRIDEGLRITTDPARFESILENLLSNAFRYGLPGEPVVIEARRVGPGAEIAVTNRAPGLSAADLPRLFERFWRKDTARSDGRAGLGLAVVRELARSLGGTIEATLDSTGRLRMTLHLPAERAQGGPKATGDPGRCRPTVGR